MARRSDLHPHRKKCQHRFRIRAADPSEDSASRWKSRSLSRLSMRRQAPSPIPRVEKTFPGCCLYRSAPVRPKAHWASGTSRVGFAGETVRFVTLTIRPIHRISPRQVDRFEYTGAQCLDPIDRVLRGEGTDGPACCKVPGSLSSAVRLTVKFLLRDSLTAQFVFERTVWETRFRSMSNWQATS